MSSELEQSSEFDNQTVSDLMTESQPPVTPPKLKRQKKNVPKAPRKVKRPAAPLVNEASLVGEIFVWCESEGKKVKRRYSLQPAAKRAVRKAIDFSSVKDSDIVKAAEVTLAGFDAMADGSQPF